MAAWKSGREAAPRAKRLAVAGLAAPAGKLLSWLQVRKGDRQRRAGKMANDVQSRSGGCQCGRVRFEAQGSPTGWPHCHCVDCRRATASALTTYAGFNKTSVRFAAGQPASYQSSPGSVMKKPTEIML